MYSINNRIYTILCRSTIGNEKEKKKRIKKDCNVHMISLLEKSILVSYSLFRYKSCFCITKQQ